jgi:hypothetical protein
VPLLWADSLLDRILGYRTLPKTQLQLPILLAGVNDVETRLESDEFVVTYDSTMVSTQHMQQAIVQLGYRPRVVQSRLGAGQDDLVTQGAMPEPLS